MVLGKQQPCLFVDGDDKIHHHRPIKNAGQSDTLHRLYHDDAFQACTPFPLASHYISFGVRAGAGGSSDDDSALACPQQQHVFCQLKVTLSIHANVLTEQATLFCCCPNWRGAGQFLALKLCFSS
jgi:hypothetical protein